MTTGDKIISALESFALRREKSGQYRANSPLRPGSNSHGFTLTIDPTGEHGAFHDKVTGEFGSLYTLAEKLNIDVPRQQATETKRAYDNMTDYAKAHGVTSEVLQAAGWKEVKYFDHDHQKERPALEIPTGNNQSRYRFLDGEKPTYRSPSGYKNCWYGLKRGIALAKQTGQPLVLCNGAPSVVVAQHNGIAACALAGGGQKIPTELLEELRTSWQGEIIIALDCDSEGQIATRNYHEQLPTAAIVDLGLTARGDLADFCMLYSSFAVNVLAERAVKFEMFEETQDIKGLSQALGELTAVRKAEGRKDDQKLTEILDKTQHEIDLLRQKAQPEALRSFGEIVSLNHKHLDERRKNPGQLLGLKTHIPKLDKIVGGWQGGRLHIIYGDTNMGKSTLAVSIVKEWLKQGAGLIVPTESPPHAYLDKLVSCICRIPYDRIEEGNLNQAEYHAVISTYSMLEQMNCHVLDVGSPTPNSVASAVREGVRKYGYKWVLVDSISKMKIPGTNDIYETTRLVSDGLQDVCRETNLPFLMTCQIGRNLKDRANKTPLPNDALGAGTVEQNADVIMSLYRHDHYVKLGTLQPDPQFPENSALVRIIKHRWKDAINLGVMLAFAGGAGFYEMDTRTVDLDVYNNPGGAHLEF
jgi:replicative DNA helicase